MEERPKLGRGLEEVSQFYLTERRSDEPRRQIKPLKAHVARSVVRVCHPGACLVQSFFLANFALELARNRFGVFVWDCLDGSEAGIEAVMKSLISARNDSGEARVSLYGLPDIVIYRPDADSSIKHDGLTDIISSLDDDCYLLVNTPASILDDGLDAETILMTQADEKALLACYAYIRVILKNGSPRDISLVFDDPGEKEHAQALFRRFAAFVGEKLHVTLRYLGALSHDEHFNQSIAQARPLMLLQKHSDTKEDMTSISRSFLLNRQSQQAG